MSCPICGRKPEAAWRPFCSKRCADVDLARWLGDGYRIGGSEEDSLPDEADSGPEDHPDRPN
ncbi:DNA gyrase inhibitor YacG [Pseudogemmobacter bohemicus]|uniref:DNA gyrase inhibitor YacG n=1 Tax=Pseudogemmobacter bohemicus TaxID=2250708 RepID=UPI000DD32F3C|nr:DNA gyrase inhibitor YacG [Pseudogemmobacter bohemicus]